MTDTPITATKQDQSLLITIQFSIYYNPKKIMRKIRIWHHLSRELFVKTGLSPYTSSNMCPHLQISNQPFHFCVFHFFSLN